MEYKTNSHVARLGRFVPFKPGISEIVTELQREAQKLSLETRAIAYVRETVAREPTLILLTGNAGHGKTYICEQILRDHTPDSEDTKAILRSGDLSTVGVPFTVNGEERVLKIHTDLSQLPSPEAASYIVDAVAAESSEATTIICVNEGRLREVLSRMRELSEPEAESVSSTLTEALDACVDEGIASSGPGVHIVNLNYQSVVSESAEKTERTMVAEALKAWVVDKRSWSVCGDCAAAERGCPIYRNHQLLSDGADAETTRASQRRREGIKHVFRMAEMSGHNTTIREMLMSLAYIITGNLTCEDVEHHCTRNRNPVWYSDYAFHALVFHNDLKADELDRIPILRRCRAFDPGSRASRSVDDRFAIGVDDIEGDSDLMCSTVGKTSQSAAEVATGSLVSSTGAESGVEEGERLREAFAKLRRRDFFDLWGTEGDELHDIECRARRIGFEALADLLWLQTREPDDNRQRLNSIKKGLIAGLQAVQGLFAQQDGASQLNVTHPAFARLQRQTALLSGKISASDIEIRELPIQWKQAEQDDVKTPVSRTVDWICREVVLAVGNEELRLDLERFEYIRRAGEGYLSRRFFAADIRRILNFLGRVAANLPANPSAIRIHTPGKTFDFSISEGLVQ